MRKIILSILIISLIGIYSCGKDETAPKVMLKGESALDHVLNTEYVEAGYVALDNEDGDITANVTVSSLDINKAGEQILTYSVTDTEGNEGKETRKITVYNEANYLNGFWSGEYMFPYPGGNTEEYYEEINASDAVNMDIIFHHIGDNSNSDIIATVSGNNILFEDQTVDGKAFSVSNSVIENNNTRITVEYTLDGQKGILVLAKNN